MLRDAEVVVCNQAKNLYECLTAKEGGSMKETYLGDRQRQVAKQNKP